jgi:hypothetical protein
LKVLENAGRDQGAFEGKELGISALMVLIEGRK